MNKLIIGATAFIIVGLIIGVTVYKVIDDHNQKLTEVEEKYIIETAKKCINEKNCSGNAVSLQTLYDLDYLDLQADPVTKEYYNSSSYVEFNEDGATFIVVH